MYLLHKSKIELIDNPTNSAFQNRGTELLVSLYPKTIQLINKINKSYIDFIVIVVLLICEEFSFAFRFCFHFLITSTNQI